MVALRPTVLTMVSLEVQPLRSSFGKVFMGAAGTDAAPSDDEFNRVSFLSHFDGANNGVNNAFDDGSASNHTITANGYVTQGSFGPFARPDGEWGVLFDGTGDYLDANDGVTFGTGAFTIEFFVYLNDDTQQFFFDARPNSANTTYPVIYMLSNRTLVYYANSGTKITSSTSETLSESTWHHIAVCRSGTSTKMFLDGTQVGSTYSDSTNYADSGRMRIGANKNAGSRVKGYISNVRVVNSALYTSNFTPPTAALTAITDTKLLTCQSNRFVDNSADGLTIAPAGDPAVTAFGPFLTSAVYDAAVNGASAYFDGSGDRLHTPEDASTRVAASNFTFEAWVYPTTTTTSQKMIFTQGAPGVYSPFNVYVQGTTVRIYISINGTSWNIASNSTSSNPIQVEAWNHIALVRNGTTIGLYINGVADNTYAVSTTAFFTPTRETSVGGRDGEEYFPGYITDARLVIGTAVYTSAFTLPTAPLTAITNTKLLLNMADGQAIDSAAQNYLRLYGNANTSTDQAKFGNTSLHLTGSGDKAGISGDLVNFGTKDFTLEGFFRIAGGSTDTYFFDGRDGTSGVLMPNILFDYDQNNRIRVYSHAYIITGTSGISSNTWYHLALCRSGSSLKLFLNGTQEGSTYTTLQTYVAGSYHATIGGLANNTAQSMVGFIDEVRISQFARYTSNFTAPAEPFADKGQ